MDIEKLIERMNNHLQSLAAYSDPELAHTLEDAATALSTLQAENEKLRVEAEGMRSNWYKSVEEIKKLRAELEQVKAGRDAAVERIREWEKFDTYLFVHNFITPEKWRGPGKEN